MKINILFFFFCIFSIGLISFSIQSDPELIELEQQIQQKALSNKQDNYKTKVLKPDILRY